MFKGPTVFLGHMTVYYMTYKLLKGRLSCFDTSYSVNIDRAGGASGPCMHNLIVTSGLPLQSTCARCLLLPGHEAPNVTSKQCTQHIILKDMLQ